MNSYRFISKEACQSCQTPTEAAAPSDGNNQTMPEGFTYDEGGGVKDQLIIQGPVAEVFRQALELRFQKKSLSEVNATAIDKTIEEVGTGVQSSGVATESQAQDAGIQDMLSEIASTPGADVVLGQFDYRSVQEHVERMENGQAIPQNELDAGIVPVYVARMQDLENNKTLGMAYDQDVEFLVVDSFTKPRLPGQGDTHEGSIIYVGGKEAAPATVYKYDISDDVTIGQDMQGVGIMERTAALESLYANTRSKVHFGIAPLVARLQQHLDRKKVKAQ